MPEGKLLLLVCFINYLREVFEAKESLCSRQTFEKGGM